MQVSNFQNFSVNKNNQNNLGDNRPKTQSFNNLPNELILEILDFLKVINTRPLLLTNHKFNSITKDHLKIHMQKYLTKDEANALFQVKTQVKTTSLMQKAISWWKSSNEYECEYECRICNLKINAENPDQAEKIKKFLLNEGYLKTIGILLDKKILKDIPFDKKMKITENGSVMRSTTYELGKAYIQENNIEAALDIAMNKMAALSERELYEIMALRNCRLLENKIKSLQRGKIIKEVSDKSNLLIAIIQSIVTESDFDLLCKAEKNLKYGSPEHSTKYLLEKWVTRTRNRLYPCK